MAELKWDEQDFLECLATLPEVDEDGIWYTYRVRNEGLALVITLWTYQSIVQFSLVRETSERPVTELSFVVRGPVWRKQEKYGDFLIFPDCVLASVQFYGSNLDDVFDRVTYPSGITVQVSAYPDIHFAAG